MYSTKIWGQLLKLAEMYKVLLHCLHGERFSQAEDLKMKKAALSFIAYHK